MSEFLRLCFAPFNLPITVMLMCVGGYWCMFLVGAISLDAFDSDVDLDLDPDLDLDLDVDADLDVGDLDVGDLDTGGLDVGAETDVGGSPDVDGEVAVGDGEMPSVGNGPGSWWVGVLRFFNVGDVPVVVLFSGFACSLWALTILSSYYYNPELDPLWSALWLVPNLVLSLLVTKFVTSPFRFVFRQANMGIEKPTRFVGKTCVVTSTTVTPRFGQARYHPPDGSAPVLLNIRSRVDASLTKGEEAVILEHDPESRTYLVAPFRLGE